MKIIILLLLASCSTVPLTKKEMDVRVLRHSDANTACRELASVVGWGLHSSNDTGRINELKRETVKAGGDTVLITDVDNMRNHHGVAYSCNPKK